MRAPGLRVIGLGKSWWCGAVDLIGTKRVTSMSVKKIPSNLTQSQDSGTSKRDVAVSHDGKLFRALFSTINAKTAKEKYHVGHLGILQSDGIVRSNLASRGMKTQL